MNRKRASDRSAPKVALLWRGDRPAPDVDSLENHRLGGVVRALRRAGIDVEGVPYAEEFADEVRARLIDVDAVLVWVNPIDDGRDRSTLDAMLESVADAGVLVSAHPAVIQKMGTKEVLFSTRTMGWGSDTHLYATAEQLRERLPARLAQGRPRVLKQYRGNGGNGVWKVELASGTGVGAALVRVRHALRGSAERVMPLPEFLTLCDEYFSGQGRIVDQAYQERLPEGMIRCYLVRDTVVGFGHQAVNALFPAPAGAEPNQAPEPGPRAYHPPTKPEFQALKSKLERDWLPEMLRVLGLDAASLPVIWDADFLLGPKGEAGEDAYVLCEINVSSVFPFPDDALDPLAAETLARISARAQS